MRTAGLLLLLITGFGATAAVALERGTAVEPDEVRGQVQGARQVVGDLIREYEPTNDQFVLRCLREKDSRLEGLSASVASAAAILRRAEVPSGGELTARGGQASDAGQQTRTAQAVETLDAARRQAQTVVQEARACLRIASGQEVRYGGTDVEAAPDDMPDLDLPPPPVSIEPEPIDRPLSPLESR